MEMKDAKEVIPDSLTRLVNLTSACLNQQHTRVVGSGCKVITQDADNFDEEI